MPTLPITAVLCTKNGIVLRYADGTYDAARPISELQYLSDIELEAIKHAYSHPG